LDNESELGKALYPKIFIGSDDIIPLPQHLEGEIFYWYLNTKNSHKSFIMRRVFISSKGEASIILEERHENYFDFSVSVYIGEENQGETTFFGEKQAIEYIKSIL
jgi:hypothetical protein